MAMLYKDWPLVSVIVPTRNSASHIRELLASLTTCGYAPLEVLINDDVSSRDDTGQIVASFASHPIPIRYLRLNISMAQGRASAARVAKGEILLHLDSDMRVTPGLIGECVELIRSGYDALVVPEKSFGLGFWANCKALEKELYQGVEEIESVRCITRELYETVGGHDEILVFSEDKDLDLRVRARGARIGRTKNVLQHNEGHANLRDILRKRQTYSGTSDLFANKHPEHYRWQANPLHRYAIFLRGFPRGIRRPHHYAGLLFLKSVEYGFSFFGVARERLRR